MHPPIWVIHGEVDRLVHPRTRETLFLMREGEEEGGEEERKREALI